MNVNLIIGAAGIPKGFKLCHNKTIKHPVDNMDGALLQNESTGIYVHYAAGIVRSINQNKAKELIEKC